MTVYVASVKDLPKTGANGEWRCMWHPLRTCLRQELMANGGVCGIR